MDGIELFDFGDFSVRPLSLVIDTDWRDSRRPSECSIYQDDDEESASPRHSRTQSLTSCTSIEASLYANNHEDRHHDSQGPCSDGPEHQRLEILDNYTWGQRPRNRTATPPFIVDIQAELGTASATQSRASNSSASSVQSYDPIDRTSDDIASGTRSAPCAPCATEKTAQNTHNTRGACSELNRPRSQSKGSNAGIGNISTAQHEEILRIVKDSHKDLLRVESRVSRYDGLQVQRPEASGAEQALVRTPLDNLIQGANKAVLSRLPSTHINSTEQSQERESYKRDSVSTYASISVSRAGDVPVPDLTENQTHSVAHAQNSTSVENDYDCVHGDVRASRPTTIQGSPPLTVISQQVPPLQLRAIEDFSASFERLATDEGFLSIAIAMDAFSQSNLPENVLYQIWSLADRRERAYLDRVEYIVAMHLIACMKSHSIEYIPDSLPAGLFETVVQDVTALSSQMKEAVHTGPDLPPPSSMWSRSKDKPLPDIPIVNDPTTTPQLRLNVPSAKQQRRGSIQDGTIVCGHNSECAQCEQRSAECYYCNACFLSYCVRCWDKIAAHRLKMNNVIPHEKSNLVVALKVESILRPNLTDEHREKLHEEDIDTTWFGVSRMERELPIFRDYGRYANLIAHTKEQRREIRETGTLSPSTQGEENEMLHPSLVSFVGETGAGKSTLIKLIIELQHEVGEGFPTPVIGAPGKQSPTSEDVHLYLDPRSSTDLQCRAPLLFADCEGLRGGAREPLGAILKKKLERQARLAAQTEGNMSSRRPKHVTERELLWATDEHKRGREYAVANLYPRILSTFSDVIVFVVKNERVIESVFEHLVDWAHAALEKSSNQPTLPHAIIAFNASDNSLPDKEWDVDVATVKVMTEVSKAFLQNATFKKLARHWNEQGREVESIEQLIWIYYKSLKVVRIPAPGRPNLINRQVACLSETIRDASREAQRSKAELRMLLDADEIQPYLEIAFGHFAKNLEAPFDFIQASFANSPIPNTFGGNILKLALHQMETHIESRRYPNLAQRIFSELSYLVASCIMLDATRNKIRGHPDDILGKYLVHLDDALENFCDRHWPCEYEGRGGRCVNVRSGHGAKGHQLKSGKLVAHGAYESKFRFNEKTRREFHLNVHSKVTFLDERIRSRTRDDKSDYRAAAEIHSNLILRPYFQRASALSIPRHPDNNAEGLARAFFSHTVCLSCLFEPPEHALPCGHIICTPCLKSYGEESRETNKIVIECCPIDPVTRRFRVPWEVYIKPAGCGVRTLVLDGGGVRGIVELETLKLIANEFDNRINIQSFFDLIVGTSTGGIIALGLTVRNFSLMECADQFEAFCAQAFKPRKFSRVPVMGDLVKAYNHSTYKTKPLQDGLIETFSKDQYLFGGKRFHAGSQTMDIKVAKVAVTATSTAGNAVVFANYNRLCLDRLPYHFQRPEQLKAQIKTWEAARATSAAVNYFEPYLHEPTKQSYVDGGLYHNCPIMVANSERKLIWPDQKDEEPDIMLSIGTGCRRMPKEKGLTRNAHTKGIVAHYRNLKKLAVAHVHKSLDSENTWRDFIQTRKPTNGYQDRYIRLNAEFDIDPPKLDNVESLTILKKQTAYSLGDSNDIKVVARRLAASSFYFEVTSPVEENVRYSAKQYIVSGNLRCRFTDAHEVVAIGKFIKKNAEAGHLPFFQINVKDRDEESPRQLTLDDKVLNRMINHGSFVIPEAIVIQCSARDTVTEIVLCLTRDRPYAISGTPRKLHAEKTPSTGNRHVLMATNSLRWASRTPSQRGRAHIWKQSTLYADAINQDVIERYADGTHELGGAMLDSRYDEPLEDPYDQGVSGSFESPRDFDGVAASSRLQRVELAGRNSSRRLDLDFSTLHHTARSAPPSYEYRPEQRNLYTINQDRIFSAGGEQLLSASRGELVNVISHDSRSDYWFVELVHDRSRRGFVPISCLRPMLREEPTALGIYTHELE